MNAPITTAVAFVDATPLHHSPEYWAKLITSTWTKSTAAVFETGSLLLQAKDDLEHGEWLAMFKSGKPFSVSKAERLMKIAEHPWLANSAIWPILPQAWRVLYELAQWSPESLERALHEGRIHADMTLADAKNLLVPQPPRAPPLLRQHELPMRPRQEDVYSQDAGRLFAQFLRAYFPTVPIVELFARTGPRRSWEPWGIEVTPCPGTRTINIKMPGDTYIICLPDRIPPDFAEDETNVVEDAE